MDLKFTPNAGGLSVQAPSSAAMATPGNYLLFVIEDRACRRLPRSFKLADDFSQDRPGREREAARGAAMPRSGMGQLSSWRGGAARARYPDEAGRSAFLTGDRPVRRVPALPNHPMGQDRTWPGTSPRPGMADSFSAADADGAGDTLRLRRAEQRRASPDRAGKSAAARQHWADEFRPCLDEGVQDRMRPANEPQSRAWGSRHPIAGGARGGAASLRYPGRARQIRGASRRVPGMLTMALLGA